MDYDLMRRRLVEARELIGCNRKEFAEKLNIPYRTITNYENGSREAGSDYLARVATVCGVTIDWILGVSDNKKSPSAAEAVPGDEIENQIMDLVRRMLPEQKALLLALLHTVLEQTQGKLAFAHQSTDAAVPQSGLPDKP